MPLPLWPDITTFPAKHLNLFLPGISSQEFLTDQNTGKVWTDPDTGQPVDQTHGGAAARATGAACSDCHTVTNTEPFTGSLFDAGSMESLAPQRSGMWTPAPHP
jgi:hypothetical protein